MSKFFMLSDGFRYTPCQGQRSRERNRYTPCQRSRERNRYTPCQKSSERNRYTPCQKSSERNRYTPCQGQKTSERNRYTPCQGSRGAEVPLLMVNTISSYRPLTSRRSYTLIKGFNESGVTPRNVSSHLIF